jgi:ectoine hydroxylase-related dioxygenase (phytanoyl-CoA dioxygenase family)
MSEILKQFNESGFYIARKLIDENVIIETTSSIKKHFDNQLVFLNQSTPIDIFDSMKRLHSIDIERYTKTVSSLWRKMSVYNLLHHPSIQRFVCQQFHFEDVVVPGGQVVLIQAESLRIPGGYFGLSPHQDFPSVNGSLDGFVVWVPLVKVDHDNYPMELIPGSHQKGIYPSFENKQSIREVEPEYYSEADFIPVLCDIGDVVFMSNFTIHRSSIKGLGNLRLACSTRYDNTDEPSFINKVYSSAYIRSVDRGQYKNHAK